MNQDSTKVPDCKICMVPHDEDIHSATLAVRRWFGGQVTKHFQDCEPDPEVEVAGTAA